MASRKEYEMLFALEAQLGREFRNTFAQARGELGDTGASATSFGSQAASAMEAVSSAITAAGITALLGEMKQLFDECTQASMDFESAMTGVAKTTDLTDEEFSEMSDAIMEMSTRIPASTEEIAAVAEAAGQLGIQKESLLDFTEVMTMLGTSTNMTAEDAATALAKFANITGMSADNYDRLGAVIVDLGNNFATTESDITQMSTRLASAGKLAGLSEAEIMALSAAMSSVGIEAEAGGTAMTQTLNAIETAVAEGGESIQGFADVAGMSAEEFAAAWNDSAITALTAFIRGLGNLDESSENATLVLDELGLTGIRQSNMLKSLALAADEMDSAVQTANTAWEENTALLNEANKRYDTTQSKLEMMQNAYNNLQVAIGDAFTPALSNAYDIGNEALQLITKFVQENPGLIRAITTFVAVMGTATAAVTAYAAAAKIVKALDMATLFTGVGGKFMLVATAIAGAVTAFEVLVDIANSSGIPTVKELTESARDLSSAMNEAKASCADTITDTQASADVAKQYIDRLDELNAIGDLTTEQQNEYHGILVMLTQTIPELADCINLETDEIQGGTAALRANTDAWKENAMAQAYQDQLTEIYSKYSDTMVEAKTNELKLRNAQGEEELAIQALNDEIARQSKVREDAAKRMQEYYEETGVATEVTAWMAESEDELQRKLSEAEERVETAQGTVENYTAAIEDGREALAEAQTEIDLATEAVAELTGSTETSTEATDDANRGYEDLNATISETYETLQFLTDAYTEAYEAAQESIEGQYSLWSEADETIATPASSINNALQTQIEHWQSYNENLENLRDRASEIDGLNTVISSFADGSTESVNAIAGMASASDEDLTAMVENWRELETAQSEAAQSIADIQTDFSDACEGIVQEVESSIASMDLGSEAAAAGAATIQGYIDGATSLLPQVQAAYSQISNAMLTGTRSQKISAYNTARQARQERAYASGTSSAEAGLALVGEEGPELVMMRGGEQVLNASRTQSTLEAMTTGSSSGNVEVVFNIEGNVDTAQMDRLEAYGDEFASRVMAVVREADTESRRGRYV